MADKTAILSVGIDVGTSTTQVVFSKLQMDNAGGYFSVPRVAIVDKEVVYKSEVYMTPLKTDVLIDTDALRDIVAAEFRKAGYRPEDTDSGAVIITGESARKENSDAVLKSLSDEKTAADIKNADAIVVSVGGNDFFHRKDIMIDALKNALLHGEGFFPEEVTNIYDEYEKNLSRIIDEIKNMNPDAYIIVQTVYNPFLKQTLNFSYINVGKTANRYVTRLNDSIKNVCKTKNRVFVFDVAPEMNEDAENFYGTDEKLDIHPTKHGHATLARVFTEKFNGLLKD